MNAVRLTYLYDGACVLCAAETARLRQWDRGRGTLRLVDISAPGFDPSAYGTTLGELMDRVHAYRADGSVLVGMDAVRAGYDAVGLGWLLAPTRWPGLRVLFDRFYLWFARNRYRMSGAAKCEHDRCAR